MRKETSIALRSLIRAIESGARRRFEVELEAEDGRNRPVEVKISSVVDDKKRSRCVVGLFSDLTLKKEVLAAERRIQKLQELQVMAMGIAHEIRNPLASISGCVQEIARACPSDGDESSYARIVVRESERLDRIIEEFLRYARSSPIDLRPVDLVQVVNEAVVLLRQRPDLDGRTVEWEGGSSSVRVYGDHDRLLQVFLNLGLNALQATPAGGRFGFRIGERPVVRVQRTEWSREASPGPGGEVLVWGEGGGMSPADLGRAFTPFFTTKQDGGGLGLSIVESILREHRGQIHVETEEGRGTRVAVRLPRSEAGPHRSDAEGEPASIEREPCRV